MFVRATIVWFGLFLGALLNATFRESVIKRFIFDATAANQVSSLTAVLLFGVFVWLTWPWLHIRKAKHAVYVGFFWLVLTFFTESLVIGRWLLHLSWQKILASYDLIGGNLWPIVLLWIAVLPVLVTIGREQLNRK